MYMPRLRSISAVMAALPLGLACGGGEEPSDTLVSTFSTTAPMETTGTDTDPTATDPTMGSDSASGDGDGDPDTDTSANAECGDGAVQAGEQCDLGPDNSATGQCTPDCQINVCGDGYVYEGFEDCDDGNSINTDDCVEGCALAACGDGFVHEGVEMCDDGNDDETDECTSLCVSANCGDGIIQEGEQCDDGNMDTSDDCPACQFAFCGDGFTWAGMEECDDANDVDDDSCTNECIALTKRVFVSSEMYNGNLGGLDGADAKCQELADAANLGGTFMAWIATNEGNPASRFTQSTTAYTLVNGTQIAPNWAGLIDGSLDAPLNLDEYGDPMPIGNTSCAGGGQPTVWSSVSSNGTGNGGQCSNYTSTAGSGQWGNGGMSNASWTSWCSGGICTWESPIYCFQQ